MATKARSAVAEATRVEKEADADAVMGVSTLRFHS